MLRYEKLSGLHAGVADHETFVQAPEKAGQDMTRHVYVASGAGAHAGSRGAAPLRRLFGRRARSQPVEPDRCRTPI
jgi:hypothetical protein